MSVILKAMHYEKFEEEKNPTCSKLEGLSKNKGGPATPWLALCRRVLKCSIQP